MLSGLIILAAMLLGLLLACSNEPEGGTSGGLDPRYADWKTITYRNIRVRYPEGHLFEDRMLDFARGYPGVIERDCRLLEIPVPTETLTVLYHTGVLQGREWTGRQYPFVEDSTIYFWMPSFLGPTLMEYLMAKWVSIEPRYQFLKHGLYSLADYSGQNYHEFTQSFLDTAGFIPLVELSTDTLVNSNKERIQSAEGASFVDFILYTYGQPVLNALYRADAPIDEVIPTMLNITADSLQAEWLDYVWTIMAGETPRRKKMPWSEPPDSTAEPSSTVKEESNG